jgi:hypothetical protein
MIDYNKTDFSPPVSQRRAWETHVQHGYSLGPAMQHYRCQNVYIASTASRRIVDTLEFFPHNSPMPKISSMDRLILAVNDMADALIHPHPYVLFAIVVDDTITAWSQLATIFKNKSQKPLAPELVQAPGKAAENKQHQSIKLHLF